MNNSGKKKFIIDKYKIAMSNHEIFEELSLKDKIDADDRIWEEFKNQLLDKIPKKLYKYQTISKNHYNSLINDEAYFSSPNKFNDTYDFTINFDLEEEIDYFDNNKEACLKDYCLTFFKYISDYYKINVDTSEIDKVIIIYKDGRFNEKSAREYLLSKTDRENANKIIKYVKNANRNLLTSEFKKTIKGYVKNFINTNKKIREETKILCLSEDCNNDMMWGKYTNESKGYCLEYSFEVKKKR